MLERYGDVVLGLEQDSGVVHEQREAGRNVILGAATDPVFWRRLDSVRVLMLAMPKGREAAEYARVVRQQGYTGPIAATAHFVDQIPLLEAAGVDLAFNFYADAGAGFAEHVAELHGRDAPDS
jgi:hypothetical protein